MDNNTGDDGSRCAALYFRDWTALDGGVYEYQWYKLGLENDVNPVPIGGKISGELCGIFLKPLFLDSKIFVLGGSSNSKNNCSGLVSLDTRSPEKGLQKGPFMKTDGVVINRSAVLSGKIYVVTCVEKGESFGEFFYPIQTEWDALPSDTCPVNLGDDGDRPSFVFSDPSEGRLLILFELEGVILWSIESIRLTGSVYAFDMDHKQYMEVVWPSDIVSKVDFYKPLWGWDAILDLGDGNICLAHIQREQGKLNFVTFHVAKQPTLNKLHLVQPSVIKLNVQFHGIRDYSDFVAAAATP